MAAGTDVVVVDDAPVTNTRVLFSCTGIGVMNRGIETFFSEAFAALKDTPGLETLLAKGLGPDIDREKKVWTLPRTGRVAKLFGTIIGRNAYVAEQLSSFLPIVRVIRKFQPHVIFYSDSNLGFQLFRWRRQIGVEYKLLFSNGGPCAPPFDRTDYVQQITPHNHAEALAAKENPQKHFMVPYGFHLPSRLAGASEDEVRALRVRLGVPIDRPILLSVGWISRAHKRMDYLIHEVARLGQPRPFLILLGAIDGGSDEIFRLAQERLGSDGHIIRSVRPSEMTDYYAAADLFILGSLHEGFGRVFVEALGRGLPVVAHRHPVMEYVLGEEETLLDLAVDGVLASHLAQNPLLSPSAKHRERRRFRAHGRFSWDVLVPQYRKMFECSARNVGNEGLDAS